MDHLSVVERVEARTLLEMRFVGPFVGRFIGELLEGSRPACPPTEAWSEEARVAFQTAESTRSHFVALDDASRLVASSEYPRFFGDLQVHSTWSDGHDSPEVLAQAAEECGYQYLGITDHTAGLRIARGMTTSGSMDRWMSESKSSQSPILCSQRATLA